MVVASACTNTIDIPDAPSRAASPLLGGPMWPCQSANSSVAARASFCRWARPPASTPSTTPRRGDHEQRQRCAAGRLRRAAAAALTGVGVRAVAGGGVAIGGGGGGAVVGAGRESAAAAVSASLVSALLLVGVVAARYRSHGRARRVVGSLRCASHGTAQPDVDGPVWRARRAGAKIMDLARAERGSGFAGGRQGPLWSARSPRYR